MLPIKKITIKNCSNLISLIILILFIIFIIYIASIIYVYQDYRLGEFRQAKVSIFSTSSDNQNHPPTLINETGGRKITLQAKELDPLRAENIIHIKAKEIVNLLEGNDWQGISGYLNADKGLRFSPYSYVSDKDIVLTKQQIKDINNDKTLYVWGQADGIGTDIKLTFEDFYYQYIYDRYFSKSADIYYNQSVSSGNTINNAFDFYPQAIIVEYYFDGQNPRYGGLDWKALRLVFEQTDGSWYLVGIIHDQWTI